MIVPSIQFLGFAAIAAVLFNLSTAAWWREAILLAVNVSFLASFSNQPAAFLPFAGFLVLGYAAQSVTGMGKAHRLLGQNATRYKSVSSCRTSRGNGPMHSVRRCFDTATP